MCLRTGGVNSSNNSHIFLMAKENWAARAAEFGWNDSYTQRRMSTKAG
jgi:hypothetical protein